MNERDFSSHFVPVGQPELDKLIAIYNAMLDKLREERLAAEERHQLLQKIIEASPAGVVICDFDGNIEQMNPAADKLLHEFSLEAIEAGQTGARRVKMWRGDFRDRGFMKTFYLLEELTEEMRLSEKKAYEKLIRMMSHEVNNSVGAVRSLLESLPNLQGEDFTQAVTIASDRMNSLNRFMSGFADVVRIPQPNVREVEFATVLRNTIELMRPEMQKREIALTLDAEPGMVRIDPHQIEQVLINILRNAMESIVSAGAIEVRWDGEVLTVRDSGPGIDDAVRAELFAPFFTTKRDGRGLGLTLVQEILTNHGATFWLENRDGGGAEFGVAFENERDVTGSLRRGRSTGWARA
jgi:signal transduction histidine kinase